MSDLIYSTQSNDVRKALPNWLKGLSFTHFVTLAFNQKMSAKPKYILEYSRDKLRHYHAKLECRMYGKHWHLKPQSKRLFYVAFPEKILSNMHYHLLMKISPLHEEKFNQYAGDIWRKVVKSGTFDSKPFETAINADGYLSYVSKDQYLPLNFNNTIISSEFH